MRWEISFDLLKITIMNIANFWKPAYQLFKPEEPLTTSEDLRNFYVERNNSPVETLVNLLSLEDDPAKFLLAGHRGGGKTTELRRLKQKLDNNYTVIWLDTETALNRYNIGYAEVVVLIGFEIYRTAKDLGWKLNKKLYKDLEESLKTVVYQDKFSHEEGLGFPEVLTKIGMILKRGINKDITKTLNVRPVLGDIIERVNAIIQAAEQESYRKLLVIVDGLDRHDLVTSLEMFSSSLLTELNCHIIYSIPISLRYSPNFRQPMESFQKCLDLNNPPVFECNQNFCPTTIANQSGRGILSDVVNKRLAKLGISYKDIFAPEALDLLCEKSGGVMRDLVRLARYACEAALGEKVNCIDITIAQEAVKEVCKEYTLSDYHFSELDSVHRDGKLTTKTHSLPNKGEFIVCDELLQNKFVLGYYDISRTSWFDVNPILLDDLERWQAANPTQPE